MKRLIIFFSLILSCKIAFAQEVGMPLSEWKEGEMEIHHIHTGRGESVFCIFPDGTTMMIDAGDAGPHRDPRTTRGMPDESRQAGEWIARYISARMHFKKEKYLDYVFLTHFHGDHMGGVYESSPKTKKGGDYILSGLSEVGEYIPFRKMVDRDWPTYQYPRPMAGRQFENYQNFINWKIENEKMKMERFVPGTNEQFVLVNNPNKYKGHFEVRNIVANGEVWTGKGNNVQSFFPKGESSIDENKCSAGIKITYGDFDYFNGGDLSGRLPFNAAEWRDIEKPVGVAVGPVEVCKANHHAWIDAMGDHFVSSVQPQVIVIPVWHVTHINLTTLQTMSSTGLYPGHRDIIPTNIPEITKAYIGEQNVQKLTGDGGHVVIKVDPGGKQYHVYILDASNEKFIIKSKIGPNKCR
jgi:beta-lactamase superfamily II metal-dependent hydrolase